MVEIEVMITSHHELVRELHIRCPCSSKVLKSFVFIIDELNVSWDSGISSIFSRKDSIFFYARASLDLPSTIAREGEK